MQIQTLAIQGLRNLLDCKLEFSPQLNIFYGDNGAGKSSIVESIYILGNGRSFRTARHAKVIKQGQEALTLFSQFSQEQKHQLGLQRFRNGDIQIKLDGEKLKKLSDLSKTLPLQILAPEQFELLSKGPAGRRKLLDWGVFHVEHSFLNHWQKALKVLLQRNQALKRCRSYAELTPWDQQLIPLSETINQRRRYYIEQLEPIYQRVLKQFLPELDATLGLYPGWKQNETLSEVLQRQFESDRKTGFTHSSIQKADLKVLVNEQLAAEYLSRGQQKLVTIALKLAQLELMQQLTDRYPVFLLDDIGAELDLHHQQVLLNFLAEQPKKQQIFITSVHLDPLKSLIKGYNGVKLFHVEHGAIKQQ